jgi:hypothetical protein
MADVSADKPLIIRGITIHGGRFRPSDWADRLAGAFAVISCSFRTDTTIALIDFRRDALTLYYA